MAGAPGVAGAALLEGMSVWIIGCVGGERTYPIETDEEDGQPGAEEDHADPVKALELLESALATDVQELEELIFGDEPSSGPPPPPASARSRGCPAA